MLDFKTIEENVYKNWQEKKVLDKLRASLKDKKKFYFLDGPPYTSGKIHVGTAWNQCLKDEILRYKRFRGYNVWDRGGYDMHGLPIEHRVQEKLKLKHKDDIEKYGVGKFVGECKKYAYDMMEQMNKEFDRLGVSLNHKEPYMTASNDYIEGVWWLVKKAYENKRLYVGEKVMTWCYDCGTALAKHELEYKQIKEDSIFVKFKVRDKKNEYLIVWTTTPWTIAFNLGVMANPELEYVKAKVENEIWILAKGLSAAVISSVANKKFKIIEEFKGEKLEGLKYEHPFYSILKDKYDEILKRSKNAFSVVLSQEYVDLSAGTGLVHMAPGCGPEDYEVGKKYGIPAFNTLDESGFYSKDMGKFSGLNAKDDNKKFIEALKDVGSLIETTKVEHDYAHCWRCKHPVIYRVTKQWFFKVEDLIPRMLEQNKKVNWIPKEMSERYELWIKNLKDNSITRQRYWGTPVPLWKCEKCEDVTVIGSLEELKKLADNVPEELHLPWIDKVEIKCKCGGVKKRVPDVLDVWMDSATASWNCLYYPAKGDKLFKEYFPADFILEASEQARLWFYVSQLASNIAMNKSCYNAVYSHGMVRDIEGIKMSKSLGNIISPKEILDKYGVDTFRLYMITAKAGTDLNFSWEEVKLKYRNLDILLNICNYLLNYADSIPENFGKLEIEDKWILSRLNSTIKEVTELMDNYKLDEAPLLVERLFLDLSRDYIKFIRDRSENKRVFKVIYEVLFNLNEMLSITCPYISEHIYLKLKDKYKLKEDSVFLLSWPKYSEKLINKKLEKDMDIVKDLIQAVLAEREKEKIGIRWPLRKVIIRTKNSNDIKDLKELILRQVNVKKIVLEEGNFSIELDTKVDPDLELEGYSREVIRRIQDLRKKANLNKNNEIRLFISSQYDLSKLKDHIKKTTGAKELNFSQKEAKFKDKFKVRDKEFSISFDVLTTK